MASEDLTTQRYPWETHARRWCDGARSNMTRREFTDVLRFRAIADGAPTQFIDLVDELAACPSEDEIADQITKAGEAEYSRGFDLGYADGEANKKEAVEGGEKTIYEECIAAIEAKGVEIGLTEEQIYKVINHILWDCRP